MLSLPCSYNALLADRAELEARYEGRLRGAEEASAAQLAALDGQFQQKLIHEMDRYAELAAAKEALNARWVAAWSPPLLPLLLRPPWCPEQHACSCIRCRVCRLGASS